MTPLRGVLTMVSVFLLSGCGGPSREAKIATAIQTLLANVISGNAEIYSGRLSPATAEIPCGVSGSFRALNPSFGINPGSLAASVTTDLVYTKCKFKVCGDTLEVNGASKTSVVLAVTQANEMTLDLVANGEEFSGVIDGTKSFRYRMRATTTTLEVGSLRLIDATIPAPLETDGHTYHAAELDGLADGC